MQDLLYIHYVCTDEAQLRPHYASMQCEVRCALCAVKRVRSQSARRGGYDRRGVGACRPVELIATRRALGRTGEIALFRDVLGVVLSPTQHELCARA